MKKLSMICFLCLISISLFAQKINWQKLQQLDPDKVLMQGSRKPTKVLILGTFHFAYPNLDSNKTDSANYINVLSEQRQAELQQLADVILRFQPTRFYIESWNSTFHDSLYKEYLSGTYKAGRNENYQVGYRVAKQAGLKKLYPIDASNFASDNYKKYSWLDSMWNLNNPIDSTRDKYWSQRYKKLYDTGDSIEVTLSMLENFLLMAEPKVLNRMHGNYLAAGFATQADNGPDMLAMWWYSRNLRIFNKILQSSPTQEDRIVVLIGNGHVPILKHCFQSSPEFEVIELKSLLK